MGSAPDSLADAVIFSANSGLAWAHLPNGLAPIALGDLDMVSYMMRDFLAQCELGRRLVNAEFHSEATPSSG